MTSLPDYDATYRGEPSTPGAGRVPWNIGEPQPAITALIVEGQVSSPVLDAGCGVGETTLTLAARGYDVLGVDSSPTAIDQARSAAARRGVDAEFAVADITTLAGHDGRFATVIDSTLFHSLPVDKRSDYLAAVARAARPEAVLHVLVFDRRGPMRPGAGPNAVDRAELHEAVTAHWHVDSIEPSAIHAWTPPKFTPELHRDEHGRAVFPAFLLGAHRRA